MSAPGAHIGETALPAVGTLWVGDSLDWISKLCLMTFAHHRHPVYLFHTHDMSSPGIDGIELVHAREVFDYPDAMLRQFGPAQFADIFRLHMIRKAGLIWVDADVMCQSPLSAPDDYLFGYEGSGWINNAVLCLPVQSPTLKRMIKRFADPSFVPPWLSKRILNRLRDCPEDERLMRACKMTPTALGPPALTYMLNKHGESDRALPEHVLNPVPWSLGDIYFNPCGGVEGWMNDDTLAVHLYASRLGRVHKRVAPAPGSFIAQAAQEVGFDFEEHGLPPTKAVPKLH